MTILSTDKLLVNRNAQSYYVDQQDIADKEEAGDLLLINRSGDSYRVNIEEVHDKVLDSDIVLANREGVSFRATGAELKAAIAPPGIESVLTGVGQDPLLDSWNDGLTLFNGGDSWSPWLGNWDDSNGSVGIENTGSTQLGIGWILNDPIPLKRYFCIGRDIWGFRGEMAYIQTSTETIIIGGVNNPNDLAGANIDLKKYIPSENYGYLRDIAIYLEPTKFYRFQAFATSSSPFNYSPGSPSTYPSAADTIKILQTERMTVLTTADNLVIPGGSSVTQSDGGASGVTTAIKGKSYTPFQIGLTSSTGTWSANGTNKVVYTTRKVQRLLDVAVAIDGYYPLFTLEEEANIVGNGTSHSHVVDGVTYYMPDGGTDTYHGNY